MPALASSLDAAAFPPSYGAVAGDISLPPTPPTEPFSGGSPPDPATVWSASRSASLYKIDSWGEPYFSVNPAGNISVRPFGAATLHHQEIDLMKVVKKVSDPKSASGLGLPLPLIVRFPDILKNRLESLQWAFDSAIRSQGYGSHYQGVYPVKCNQDRFVVEDIVRFGSSFRFGLEAGSKPELLLAMSCISKGSSPEAFLVCNGYKDAEYISLALIARKLNLNTVIVLEQEEELDLVIEISRGIGVRPAIGLRAKLRTKHSGHFGYTSGEKGKFGLTTSQILNVVRKLEKFQMMDCLQLLHFHIGSQIPSTALLADGVGEAAQIYCELVRLGAGMSVIDIGGGLGIDYDGSRSANSDMSVAYSLEEYAVAVVQAIRCVCEWKFVKHPVICSESGRALVSHHSVLIFEAVSSSAPIPPSVAAHFIGQLVDEALEDYKNLEAAFVRRDYDACLMYAEQLKWRCVDQFKQGSLGLEELAAAEGLCEFVLKVMGVSDPVLTYHVNLSLFTSIPDYWAIGQLFPIVPIHRLDERPAVKGVLSDLTCDSDGKIDKFIGGESSLPLHEFEGGDYYLGMFLGGAYQEALGGLHNLFGRPCVVRVSQIDGPHSFSVTRAVMGLSCGDVLRSMQHEPELMFQSLKCRAEEHCTGSGGNVEVIIPALARSFHSMPYLSDAFGLNAGYCMDGQDEAGGGDEWTYCCA